jgi:hypothetical protein
MPGRPVPIVPPCVGNPTREGSTPGRSQFFRICGNNLGIAILICKRVSRLAGLPITSPPRESRLVAHEDHARTSVASHEEPGYGAGLFVNDYRAGGRAKRCRW